MVLTVNGNLDITKSVEHIFQFRDVPVGSVDVNNGGL